MHRGPAPFDLGPVHFIGIGGIGMSGIAEIMLRRGYVVQGSDARASANTERLASLGATVFIGHDAAHVTGASAIVHSSAIHGDNPEMVAGRAARIPLVRRAEMLAELMRLRFSIAVGGTHGKTTTTSMIAAVLDAGGLDPTVVNGGIINAYGANAKVGEGEWIVVEADESDGTFLKLHSTVAVVTNIDPEHLDHHGDFAGLKRAFADFVRNIPFYGFAAVCVDDPDVQEMISEIENRRLIPYGLSPQAEIRAVDVAMGPAGSAFTVRITDSSGNHRDLEGVTIPMAGTHNVLNALAAFAVGRELGIASETIKAGLAQFGGVRRRFTTTGVVGGVRVIDDYGHHPTEIASVLAAARANHRGPGDRGGPAASLHPAARPVPGVLRLLQRRRRGDCGGCLSRGRGANRGLRSRRLGRRHPPPWPPPSRHARWTGRPGQDDRSGSHRWRSRRLSRRGRPDDLGPRPAGPAGGAGRLSWLDGLAGARGKVLYGEPLAPFTWLRVGGPAEALFLPADEDDLAAVLTALPAEVPVTVLGVGSNVIVRDGGIDGLVVRLAGKVFAGITVDRGSNQIVAGAATLDGAVARAAARAGIAGLEFYAGIPGTIGGALTMNAGCYGSETKDRLLAAWGVDRSGERRVFTLADLAFSYRHSATPKGFVWTGAAFKGVHDDHEAIGHRMTAITARREASQPIREKTGGSTFRNPPGFSAWRLIDEAGWRGRRVGGAMFSPHHANFLINTGDATAADLEELGEIVRDNLRDKTGIQLEWEIKRLGRAT